MSENISAPQTASVNLSRIVERIKVLELLYNQISKTCYVPDPIPGLGYKNETSIIGFPTPRGLIPVPSLSRKTQRPKTFQETLDLIGVFLVFLSGQTLSPEQMKILGDSSSDLSMALAFEEDIGKLGFDEIVEPYIQWLSSINQK